MSFAIWDCRGNPFDSCERLELKPGSASCGNRPKIYLYNQKQKYKNSIEKNTVLIKMDLEQKQRDFLSALKNGKENLQEKRYLSLIQNSLINEEDH